MKDGKSTSIILSLFIYVVYGYIHKNIYSLTSQHFPEKDDKNKIGERYKEDSIVPKLFYFKKKGGGGNVSIQLILGGKIKMFLILF